MDDATLSNLSAKGGIDRYDTQSIVNSLLRVANNRKETIKPSVVLQLAGKSQDQLATAALLFSTCLAEIRDAIDLFSALGHTQDKLAGDYRVAYDAQLSLLNLIQITYGDCFDVHPTEKEEDKT